MEFEQEFDVQTDARIHNVVINGIPAKRLYSQESSRRLFIWGELLIKFDMGGFRESYDPVSHQSSEELEKFFDMDEEDREFFLTPLGGKIIPVGEWGYGYIIQPYIQDMERHIPARFIPELLRVLNKYKITDISLLYGDNCGFSPSLDRPVIYDWGMRYSNGRDTSEYNYFCGNYCGYCGECSEFDMED